MDPFHFVHASTSGPMLPLLIFAIYIVISMVNASQTKKKKQHEQEELRRRAASAQTADRSGQANAPVQHEKPKVMDELRRELEIILSDRDEKKIPPQPEKKKEQQQEQIIAPVVFDKKKAPAEPQKTEFKPYYLADTYESLIADTAITDAAPHDFEQTAIAVPVGSLDEARKGVVWSEILGPPKALKE
jgi:hypothetical protein